MSSPSPSPSAGPRAPLPDADAPAPRSSRPSRSPSKSRRRWWKRPSIYWALVLGAIKSFQVVVQVAPVLEIYTRMICQRLRPDIDIEHVRYPDWRDDPAPPPVVGVPLPEFPSPWLAFAFAVEAANSSVVVVDDAAAVPNSGKTKLCAKDPDVLKTRASFIAVLGGISGTFTMLTSAWWGQRADIWGRTTVLALSVVALLISDSSLVLVTYFSRYLPGSAYWWLVPASIIEGILGGSAGIAAERAYLSDCAEPSARSAIFAIDSGVTMAALALGPIIGAQLVHYSGDLLSVFYFSLVCDVLLLLCWTFVVPESLPRDVRAANLKKWEEVQAARDAEREADAGSGSIAGRVYYALHLDAAVDLFAPLAMLLPRYRDANDHGKGRDWNLTLLGIAFLILCVSGGASSMLMQLSQILWGWDSEMVGYWLSLVGATRAVYLLLVFPVIIRIFKPKAQPVALPGPEEQLHAPSGSDIAAHDEPAPEAEAETDAPPKGPPVPWFDLSVVRLSLVFDVVVWFFVLTAQTPGQWLAGSAALSIGSALVPTVMSLAVALAPGGDAEAGRLFGAFGVMLSLGASVVGQLVFGALFRFTVTVFPRAVLLVQFLGMVVALGIMFFVRLPKSMPASHA